MNGKEKPRHGEGAIPTEVAVYMVRQHPLYCKDHQPRRAFLNGKKDTLERGLVNISASWFLVSILDILMWPFST
jgi:hypothetical protein